MRKHVASTFLCLVLAALPAAAQKLAPWELANVVQPGQHTTYLKNMSGGFCGIPVEIGDFDADGFPDWAIAPILADSGPLANRVDSGEIVVFKGNGSIGGIFNYQSLPMGQPLAVIYGAVAHDLAGTEIYASDVTGDGITDLLIGATGADPNGRAISGAVYLVRGGPLFSGVIDLASPPANVTTFQGIDPFDRLGFWVEAGDIDGDGLNEILMSADEANGPNNAFGDRGEAYVIWGGQSLPAVIDMANPPSGLQYTTIYGIDNNDQLGSTMHAADLDSDGFEEVIVSAALNRAVAAQTGSAVVGGDGPLNNRSNCGETYVIWGSSSRPAVIDLGLSAGAMLGAGTLTIVYGANSGDCAGEELSSGDFDGDGYKDLAIGALTADGFMNSASAAGDAIVIYGGPSLRGQAIDLATNPAGVTFIYGSNPSDILADTLSARDVNGDGYDDLFIAIPGDDPQIAPAPVTPDAGSVLILFGGPVRWPAVLRDSTIDMDLGRPSRRIYGVDAGDLCGYSMEGGDIDQDGFADVFPNMMRADGFQNMVPDAGDVAIVSGQRLSRGIVTLKTPPTLGTVVCFDLTAEPNIFYGVGFAGAAFPGQPVPGTLQTLYLAPDALFALTTQVPLVEFMNFSGYTDASGKAVYGMALPNIPSFAGFELYTAFATYDIPNNHWGTISATTSFVLQL